MLDQYLLNAIRVLETQESLKNPTSAFMMGCPKDAFDTFREHPTLGPWLAKTYPHTLAVIDAYFDEPEDERNMHEDPFRYHIQRGAPVRVMLVSNTDTTVTCEFPDWHDGRTEVVMLRNPTHTQPVGQPGTIYDFLNPSTPYIAPVFLGDKAPGYSHDLALMMMKVTLGVLESDEGREWGAVLASREPQVY